MPIGQQDIFQAAVQLESDGRKFYIEAAEKSSDKLVRRVFEPLADEATETHRVAKADLQRDKARSHDPGGSL